MSLAKKLTLSAAAGASLSLLAFEVKRRTSPVSLINREVTSHLEVGSTEDMVIVVSSPKDWTDIANKVKNDLEILPVLGLDCEWVSDDGRAKPVALLQIATFSGLCVLVRLPVLGTIPNSLKEILASHEILKTGVAVLDDSQKLLADYGLDLVGCVDLRHLVLDFRCRNSGHPGKLGLESLASEILGVSLDKDWRLRAGDWEADILSERQIKYAANDALVAVNIFWFVVRDHLFSSLRGIFTFVFWSHTTLLKQLIVEVDKFADLKFSNRDWKSILKGEGKEKSPSPLGTKVRRTTVRKSPLYHNCMLQAPDGQVLCTCDIKKAKWYVSKGIGVLISEEPLVVRLKFEPSGRPEGKAGEYYASVKPNICVVCGKEESYLRKNIVPHEYRRYFPTVMKDHQSHDVLLMCVPCHQVSNMHDATLRNELAETCTAPIGSLADVKLKSNFALKKVRSAGRALQANRKRKSIPAERLVELEKVLTDHYQQELSDEIIDLAASANFLEENGEYVPHSRAVVQYFLASDTLSLIELEIKWRKHFLKTMKPKFLPPLWSVDHQTERLEVKAKENRIDLAQYKLATEGAGEEFDLEAYRSTKQAQLGINPGEDNNVVIGYPSDYLLSDLEDDDV